MEKLYELHDRGGFDLIVVDTPPTRHALDFLDAPRRLTRLLDNRVFRMLMVPTRGVVRVGGMAAQAFLRTISRVVGTEAVDDVVAFFRAFEGMEDGFRERAAQVMQLLAADETAFVLVTSPRRDAVEEAEYFAGRLADGEFSVDALVVNRVHDALLATAIPRRCATAPVELGARRSDAADPPRRALRQPRRLRGGRGPRARGARRPRAPDRRRVGRPRARARARRPRLRGARAVGNHLMGAD